MGGPGVAPFDGARSHGKGSLAGASPALLAKKCAPYPWYPGLPTPYDLA